MTDIVELLRDAISDEHVPPLYLESADEIERLRAELAACREGRVRLKMDELRAERDAAIKEVGKYARLFGLAEAERDALRELLQSAAKFIPEGPTDQRVRAYFEARKGER